MTPFLSHPFSTFRHLRPLLLTGLFYITIASFAFAGIEAADNIPDPPVDYLKEVRPILARHCLSCHGADAAKRKAKLRLDGPDPMAVSIKRSTPVIVPGNPESSGLYQRVTSENDSQRMPPPDTENNPLQAEEILVLKNWIQQGAPYAAHWSFTMLTRPKLPSTKKNSWPINPIDHFVLARLEQNGLTPSASADSYTLIRRVSLDLRGLPPSPEEVATFINDTASGSYSRMVDRFLADPAFGERWAGMWLDLARYADSSGYGSDPLRTIWAFRDWVIDAFNQNLSFDQFTVQQLAGDLLENPSTPQMVATAFHRNTMTNTEGGTDDEEFRIAAVKDRVDTTLQVWMGLTMGCAKCHDHKYDPISQKEYYQFFAFFNQTADADHSDERPLLKLAEETVLEKDRLIEEQLTKLREQLKEAAEEDQEALKKQIEQAEKTKPDIPTVPIMKELPSDQLRSTTILVRGSFMDKGAEVTTDVPQAFHPLAPDTPSNRLGIGQWLMDPANPLTARVTANRFWAQLFGSGIVETEEDFGTQGELPSHPQLLDWIASELIESKWNIKSLLRLIVTSATYRQTSRLSSDLLTVDPRNRLFTRGPRFRLKAEMVRDQALALSGLLSRKMHGPSVFPPQPPGLWRAAFNGDRTWHTSQGPDRYRRGLYTFWRRTVPYPSMATFDAPSREICNIRRIRTNTPLQAFVTLNDPVYVEAAQALARRIVRNGGETPEQRAHFALQLCLTRPPEAKQIKILIELYESEKAFYETDPDAAQQMATNPLGPLPTGMKKEELASWTVVSNVLLNLDEILTKR